MASNGRDPWELVEFPKALHSLRPLFGPLLREGRRICLACGTTAGPDQQHCGECFAELPSAKLYFDSQTSYGLIFLACVILGVLYVVYWGLRSFTAEPSNPPPSSPPAVQRAAEPGGSTDSSTRESVPEPPAGPGMVAEKLPELGDPVYFDELPEATTKIPPTYPEPARAAGVEGTVMVYALVGRDGKVKEVRIRRSVPMLDQAALRAVRAWVFKPARAGRESVAVWVTIPVRFRLLP